MSVPDTSTLVQKIEDTRITYPEREHGVGIVGAPFVCNFTDDVDPVEFCEEIRTAEEPWQMFGLKSQLAENYWKVLGNLYHIEDEEVVDCSKIAVEVCPEWARIYVKEGCSAERAAEFVETLDSVYGVSVEFGGATEHTAKSDDHD